MKILVVDDEKLLVKGIKFNLENEGYTVDACYDGESAVNMARTGEYDLIILDLMMPKKDGLEACQEIRGFSTVPIIMLTARSEDADMLMGFESGADDYVTKPFNILALKARVRALLRRASMSAAQEPAKTSVLTRGHISVDTERRSAYKNGVAIELTMKEFDLIEFLMKNPGRVYSRGVHRHEVGRRILLRRLRTAYAQPESSDLLFHCGDIADIAAAAEYLSDDVLKRHGL